MSNISLQELAHNPAAALDRVEAGEHIVVVRGGRPVAELRSIAALPSAPRPFGLAAGTFTVFVRYSDGVPVNPGSGITDPLVAFLPVDGRRSEGAVEIAMAPAGFGGELAGGVFAAFYGMWGQAGSANEENPLVFADPASGHHFHFVNNQVHGHLYGLLSTPTSLFMSNMAWTGNLGSAVEGVPANEAGVIYRITTVQEPGCWIMIGVAGLLALLVFPNASPRPAPRAYHWRNSSAASTAMNKPRNAAKRQFSWLVDPRLAIAAPSH